MNDLAPQIHARLAGFGCCEGYSNSGLDQSRAAVLAALAFHSYAPTGILDGRTLAVCNGCNVAYPCREVVFIARALGIEVSDAR